MSQSRRAQLMALLDCSRRMQAQAEAGDWEAVRCLQAEQRELSERFFIEPVGTDLAPECAVVIKEMLLANQQVAELGRQERAACLSGKSDIDKCRRAVRAYSENSG